MSQVGRYGQSLGDRRRDIQHGGGLRRGRRAGQTQETRLVGSRGGRSITTKEQPHKKVKPTSKRVVNTQKAIARSDPHAVVDKHTPIALLRREVVFRRHQVDPKTMGKQALLEFLCLGTRITCNTQAGKTSLCEIAQVLREVANEKGEMYQVRKQELKREQAVVKQADKAAKAAEIMACPIPKKISKTTSVPQGQQVSSKTAPICPAIHEHPLVRSRTLKHWNGSMRSVSGCCSECRHSNLECYLSCTVCNFDICRRCHDKLRQL